MPGSAPLALMLDVRLRDPFLRAVAHELQGCSEIGPGAVHQICREQQRIFMNGAWPGRAAARTADNSSSESLSGGIWEGSLGERARRG